MNILLLDGEREISLYGDNAENAEIDISFIIVLLMNFEINFHNAKDGRFKRRI